jgi:glycosyltransferase involved in cell wall biosynthesis
MDEVHESAKPHVSIVTVSKDDFKGFQNTLKSIKEQSYPSWQMLAVIHSRSKTTIEYALEQQTRDARLIVTIDEDDGIYQAMNKGMKLARGNYIVFLNSGDRFINRSALITLLTEINESRHPVVIGGYEIAGKFKELKEWKRFQFDSTSFAFNRDWGCHQAMIFSRNPVIEFDTRYELAADFDFVLRYLEDANGLRIPEVVVEITPGGRADSNLRKVYSEKFRIRQKRLFGFRRKLMNVIWTLLAWLKLEVKWLMKPHA